MSLASGTPLSPAHDAQGNNGAPSAYYDKRKNPTMAHHSTIIAIALLASACQAEPTPSAMPAQSAAHVASSGPVPKTAPTPSTAPVPSTISADLPRFDVGGGIGPIRLGMRRGEIDGLGLDVALRKHDLSVGPYSVVLENGVVVLIAVQLKDLPQGLLVGGKLMRSPDDDIEAIAKRLPNCGKSDALQSGGTIVCAEGTVIVMASGPWGGLELVLKATSSVERPE